MTAQRHNPLWTRLLLVALALAAAACAVNPVPTPATNGTTSTKQDSTPGENADASFTAGDTQAADAASDMVDGGGGAVPAVSFGTVSVTVTDAAIDAQYAGGMHLFAVAPDALPTGHLVVILPDANRLTTEYSTIAMAAAQAGHRVLVLATPVSVLSACGSDTSCMLVARQELLDGVDRTSKVQVAVKDSLIHRLVTALATLDKQRPGENWGTFYSGASPAWSELELAGHGEGASEAAVVAQGVGLWRVALIGGPVDGAAGQPAPWMAGHAAAQSDKWRGLLHTGDPAVALIGAAWTALGLGSSALWSSVDGAQQPGVSAHLLTTGPELTDPHAGIAVDSALPGETSALSHVRLAWKILFWPY